MGSFIDLSAADGFKLPAYLAAPAGQTKGAVVVLQEIFGVNSHIRSVADGYAAAGYLAIAPELFDRQGDAQGYGEMAKLIAEVISKVPDAQVMGDLDACVRWAGENGGNLDKVGVTGFCWAAAKLGCMPRTTRASRLAWRGTAVWSARLPR